MKSIFVVCATLLAAAGVLAEDPQPAEVRLALEQPLATDEPVCIIVNEVAVDFVMGKAGQREVAWRGTDSSRRVAIAAAKDRKIEAAPLATFNVIPAGPDGKKTICLQQFAVILGATPVNEDKSIEIVVGTEADVAGPFLLRLFVDFVPATEKKVGELPHSFPWSVRGLLPGKHVFTLEVLDGNRGLATSSFALEVE